MAASPLRIHSVAEAYLLLMVTPCQSCAKGPLESAGHETVDLPSGAPGRRMTARCRQCSHEQTFVFDLSDMHNSESTAPVQINPTTEPSRAIDLAQWLMLFETIARAASEHPDRAESRRLGYEAALCLEEALKFYPPTPAEWPDESAFFTTATLDRFRQHRHLFARTRLIDLRRKLPTLTEMERRLAAPPPKPSKRRWWTFWR